MIEAGTEPVLETAALDRLLRIGGQDFVVEMIELFLEHAPERLRAAQAAHEAEDYQALYRAAHSLKSTAANLGARRLQQAAERTEARANAKDLVALRPLLEEMNRRYAQVRERLETERDRRRRAPGRNQED